MTDYDYDDAEEADAPAERQHRFDPTRERGADYFVRAHRHSRLVRSLKFVLPAIAVVSVAGFFLVMKSGEMIDGLPAVISLGGINVELKSLVMEKPNISGFQGTKHSYEVTAAEAVQDLSNPKVATLNTLTATFKVGGGGETAVVNAVTGVFDSATKILLLSNGITMKTSNGYNAKFEDARIDVDKGDLSSNRPIEISAAAGTIKANGIEVTERGKRVKFLNGVTVNYIPGQMPEKTEAVAKATAPLDGATPPVASAKFRKAKDKDKVETVAAKVPATADAEPAAVKVEADAAPLPPLRPAGGPKKKDAGTAAAGTVPAADAPAKSADGNS